MDGVALAVSRIALLELSLERRARLFADVRPAQSGGVRRSSPSLSALFASSLPAEVEGVGVGATEMEGAAKVGGGLMGAEGVEADVDEFVEVPDMAL
jgi:hypothetical protein